MTASAPRPTSTSTCSTRWTSGTRSWPSPRPISWPQSGPARCARTSPHGSHPRRSPERRSWSCRGPPARESRSCGPGSWHFATGCRPIPAWMAMSARPVRLAVDRAFRIKGRGTVVTGTLRGGALARGANLRIVPGDDSVRVREVQVHGAPGGGDGGRRPHRAQPRGRRGSRPAPWRRPHERPRRAPIGSIARHARRPRPGPGALPRPPRNGRRGGGRWSGRSRRTRAPGRRRGRRAAPRCLDRRCDR